MINKQSMMDHIRKLEAEGAKKGRRACEARDEARRLTKILRRDVKGGRGTLGDSALDFALVVSGSPDDRVAEYFRVLSQKWKACQGEYFLCQFRKYATKGPRYDDLKEEVVYFGRISGEIDFNLQEISLDFPIGKYVVSYYTDSNGDVCYLVVDRMSFGIIRKKQLRAIYDKSIAQYDVGIFIGDKEVAAWDSEGSFLDDGFENEHPVELIKAAWDGLPVGC